MTDPTTSADNTSGQACSATCGGVSAGPTGSTLSDPALTSATINNQLGSSSQSGNALVDSNLTAGDATSGNAQTIANLFNLLGSAAGFSNGGLSTFISNVSGNVNGNLIIDPTSLAQSASGNPPIINNAQLESQNSGTINNDINLTANSGSAAVANNGLAGNATTGEADAVANIINIINSLIAANQSFLGIINIYGNLNGDILIPAQFVNSLLASNGSPSSAGSESTLAQDNTQLINNAISLSAASGSATVANNGTAGNATSGNALTNLMLFNLTGDQIIGGNALLVFVNVLGSWVGLIMNAPAGSTSAILGGDVTQSIIPSGNGKADVTSVNNEQIFNSISVSATSGDALVMNNGTAGNATSGNATASVNILNILGSQFDLSNWFGILFINVFGSWEGNLGTFTLPGNTPTMSSANSPAGISPAHVIHAVASHFSHPSSTQGDSWPNGQGHVFGLAISPDAHISHGNFANAPSSGTHIDIYTIISMTIVFFGLALFGVEKAISWRSGPRF